MNWSEIGSRIRKQREYLGYTRESFAEMIDVTPKFCSDIELGVKGMSVSTLCNISKVLNLNTDYILFGKAENEGNPELTQLISNCPEKKVKHLESIIKAFIMAVNS